MQQRSFFERLTSSLRMDDGNHRVSYGENDEEASAYDTHDMRTLSVDSEEDEYDTADGQLGVDVYETDDAVLIKAMVAGIKKDELEITITREVVTIRGSRYDEDAIDEARYVYQELYWGTFSRSVELPDEIDIDQAQAHEEHGLLTIYLPKIDKQRSAKLMVK